MVQAAPAAFSGKVVAIADGDSLTVLVEQQQHRVRLAEVDAPERRQPFGARARQTLASLCFQRQAAVTPLAIDRYGRLVGLVHCKADDGVSVDAASELVRLGLAWVDPRYATRPELTRLQAAAREAGLGLWHDNKAEPPWRWRQQQRTSPVAASRPMGAE